MNNTLLDYIYPFKGKIAFNFEKYKRMQIEEIEKRKKDQIIVEIGGKLTEDFHAMRVIPGFPYDGKLRVIKELSKNHELAFNIVINSKQLGKKIFWDKQMEYGSYALSLANQLKKIGNVYATITFWNGEERAKKLRKKLEKTVKRVFITKEIKNYPEPSTSIKEMKKMNKILFDEKIVVVTAPGPNAGKMFVSMLALLHAEEEGIKATYAKYETFPIYNLPPEHEVNKAYEAATAELGDYNVIDPFHLKHYGEKATNYNRDVKSFSLLKPLIEKIGVDYKSPTDMGINNIYFGITDIELCKEAAIREIRRRLYQYKASYLMGRVQKKAVERIEKIAKKYKEREVEKTREGAALYIGKLYKKKQGSTLDSVSNTIITAAKDIANITEDVIDEEVIKAFKELRKRNYKKGRLDLTETLIAITITKNKNKKTKKVWEALRQLRGADMHVSYPLDRNIISLLNKMGIAVSFSL